MTQALKIAAAVGVGGAAPPLYFREALLESNTYIGDANATQVLNTGLASPAGGYMWILKGRAAADNPTLYEDYQYAEPLATNSVGGGNEFNSYSFSTFGPDFTASGTSNTNGQTYVLHGMSLAEKFLDIQADTGTGVSKTVTHNLNAVPELIIRKEVDNPSTANWHVRHADLAALSAGNYLLLNTTAAVATATNRFTANAPTSSLFRVGANAEVNSSGKDYVTFLFATCPGNSKVGMYTGDGTAGQTIDCGFSTGARFIMIKRTDATGAWYVWDDARGIIAGNDPHWSLNASAAEVTSNDSVDPTNVGFIVNQRAATNVNVTGGNYIFLAIA